MPTTRRIRVPFDFPAPVPPGLSKYAHTAPPTLPAYPHLRPVTTRPTPNSLRSTQPTPRDINATVSASEKPVRILYGLDRVSADIIWIGRKQDAWVFHLRWGWGEVNSIVKVQLGNEDLPVGAVITSYLGTAIQGVDGTLSTLIPGYTDTLVATIGGETRGIAYSVIEIPFMEAPDTLSFTAEIQGLKVYDTRTSTTAYSTNPALHAYDFLTSTFYGPGWAILQSSVDTVADVCDVLIDSQKRYEAGTVIERPRNIHQYVETLMAACGSFLTPVAGTANYFKFVPNRPAASAETFDLEAVSVDGSEVIEPIDRRNVPNTVRVRYTDTSIEPWAEATAEAVSPAVTSGDEFPRITTLNTPYIQSHRVANRLAIETHNAQNLPQFDISWIHKDDGIRLERGDVITLDKIPGFSAAEVVRVLRNDLVRAESGYYRQITARQYDANEYDDSVVDRTPPPAIDVDGPFSPTAVSDVSVAEAPWLDASGHYQTILETTWTGVDHAHARSYRIKISSSAGANVLVEEVVLHRGEGVAHSATSPPMETGILYTVEIFTVSTVGATSAADTDTITPVGDALAAPAAPTTTTVSERLYQDDAGATHSELVIDWTGVNDPWIREYRVRVTNVSSDVILETLVKHKGVVAHTVSVPSVEQDISHVAAVWSVNVEGDQSATSDTDGITPAGRTALPPNPTNLEATEYTDYVELEWDNVLGLGDTAHRIKRGTQAQTYSTADQLDKSVFMNPDARAEDRVTWRDYDVQSGKVGYYIKGISFEGLESFTAGEVDITIQTPKGSRAKERPRIPTYIEDVIWHTEDIKISDYISFGQLGAVFPFSGYADGVWQTVLDLTSTSGVLNFVCFAFTCSSCTSETQTLGGRITLDDTVIWEEFNENVVVTAGIDYQGVVPVGLIFESASTPNVDLVDIDYHYLPFDDNLKIEIYKDITGAGSVSSLCAYNYFET